MPIDNFYQYSEEDYPIGFEEEDEQVSDQSDVESYEQEQSDQYIQAAEQFITNALATESQSSFLSTVAKLTSEQLSSLNAVLEKIERNENITNDDKEIFLNFTKPLIPYLRTYLSTSSADSGGKSKKILEDRIRNAMKRLESLRVQYQQVYGQDYTG